MIKTAKLFWKIVIIILLNILVISFVVYSGPRANSTPAAIKNNSLFDQIFSFFSVKAKAAPQQTPGGGGGSADYNLLAKVISAEARAEPYIGQVAVGAVILNRVESPLFPDTVTGVVYQPDAFTCMTDGNINQPVVESAYRAAQDALNGVDPTGGALYYYNPAKTSNQWIRSRPVVTTIGKHVFCN